MLEADRAALAVTDAAPPPRPSTPKRRRSLLHSLFWAITHVDDMAYALVRGVFAVLSTPEGAVYPILEDLVAGRPRPDLRVTTLPRDGRYVVVSDHHLLYAGAPHDYFGGAGQALEPFRNERIYAQMMKRYAADGWTLVENGDVEDLVVPEPAHDPFEGLAEGAWGRVLFTLDDATKRVFGGQPLRERSRQRQLRRIAVTYAGYYRHLVEQFGKERIVKLVGNHDAELLREEYAELLPLTGHDVDIHEFAVLPATQREPAVVICHGHQMDPWTCQATRRAIGESITESFSWLGQGADRIWLTRAWGPPLTSTNPMSRLGIASFSGIVPKVRHMSETRMDRALTRQFQRDPDARPWIVLGHTHEPRLRTAERYANTGSAGRYQDLVWAVEIVEGTPRVVAWWCEELDGREQLVRGEMAAVGEWLHCARREVLGDLEPLPYGPRPVDLAACDAQGRIEKLKYTWWWLAARVFVHLVFLAAVVGIVWIGVRWARGPIGA